MIFLLSLISCAVDLETTAATCSAQIASTSPFPDSTNMYHRDFISVELSEADEAAYIALFDANGSSIAGTSAHSGTQITFTPDRPLLPSHSYQVQVSYCGSPEPVSYTVQTSDLGEPLRDGTSSLIGKTYLVDVSSGRVLEPLGVGDLLQGLLQNTFLITVKDVVQDRLEVRVALTEAESEKQNFCVPSMEEFPRIDVSESSYISVVENDIPINIAEHNFVLHDLVASGTISPDGLYLGEIEVEGMLDLREVAPIVQELGVTVEDAESFCDVLDGFDSACQPCPTDAQPYCLAIVVDKIKANEQPMQTYPVCESNCHERCSDIVDTCEEPQSTETCF